MSRKASRVCNGFGVLDMNPGLETQRISPPQSLHLFFLWAGVGRGASTGLASPSHLLPPSSHVWQSLCLLVPRLQEMHQPSDTLGLTFLPLLELVDILATNTNDQWHLTRKKYITRWMIFKDSELSCWVELGVFRRCACLRCTFTVVKRKMHILHICKS